MYRRIILFVVLALASSPAGAKCGMQKYSIEGRIAVDEALVSSIRLYPFLEGAEDTGLLIESPEDNHSDFIIPNNDGSFAFDVWLNTDSGVSSSGRDKCSRKANYADLFILGEGVRAKRVQVSFKSSPGKPPQGSTGLIEVKAEPPELRANLKDNTVSVRAQPLQEKFALDGPICVRLGVKNISKHPLLLPLGFNPMKSFDSTKDFVLPGTLMTAILRNPDGKLQIPNAEPLLGTFGIGPDSFRLLKPGETTGFAWNMKLWPWLFSFANEGSYTSKLKLQFDLPRWLEGMQKDRHWMVSQEAVALVVRYRSSLVSGLVEAEPVAIQVCRPTSGTVCPTIPKSVSSLPPHEVCRAMVQRLRGKG